MASGFKLQSVLNYRQSLEAQAQQALAASINRQGELQEEIAQQQQELKRQDQQLRLRQEEGLTIGEIELYETRIHHDRRRCAELALQLSALEKTIHRHREELLKAARERQIMEELKEKQDAEYRRELERRERAELDEISLRNKGNGS